MPLRRGWRPVRGRGRTGQSRAGGPRRDRPGPGTRVPAMVIAAGQQAFGPGMTDAGAGTGADAFAEGDWQTFLMPGSSAEFLAGWLALAGPQGVERAIGRAVPARRRRRAGCCRPLGTGRGPERRDAGGLPDRRRNGSRSGHARCPHPVRGGGGGLPADHGRGRSGRAGADFPAPSGTGPQAHDPADALGQRLDRGAAVARPQRGGGTRGPHRRPRAAASGQRRTAMHDSTARRSGW